MPITIDPSTLSAHFESKDAEEKWDRLWQEWGVHRFDESVAGRELRDRHAAAHRLGLAPRRPRLQLHADGRARALPAHARQERLLPDGLGRQRAADRAARAELLPREVRAARRVRGGPDAADGRRRGAQAAGAPRVARQLHRAVPRAHGRGRAGVQGALAAARALDRLGARVLDDQRPGAPGGAVELPRPLPQGPGVPGRGADALGRGLPHGRRAGRGRGPPPARGVPRRALRGRGRRLVRDRDDAAGAAARLRRRRRAPGRRALPAALRQARDHAALPRAGADLRERARRAREGHRDPDGVHVRRRDRRRVVARAEAGAAADRGP